MDQNIKKMAYIYKGEEVEYTVDISPSLMIEMQIVNDVVSGVINDTIGYEPILYDYMFSVALINNLTNIELPIVFSDSADFIKETKVVNNILSEIDLDVLSFHAIIDRKIEYEKQLRIHRRGSDELFGALTKFVEKYEDKFAEIDIQDLVNKLEKIQKLSDIPEKEVISNILEFHKQETETE